MCNKALERSHALRSTTRNLTHAQKTFAMLNKYEYIQKIKSREFRTGA